MISWPFGHPEPQPVNAMPNLGLEPTAKRAAAQTERRADNMNVMRRVKSLLLPAILIATGALAPADAHQLNATRGQYDGYLGELRAAILAGDAQSLGNLVTEDRVSVSGATGKTLRGRAAQVESDRAVFLSSQVTMFEMRITDFHSSGAMAYATGVGTHQIRDRTTGQQRVDRFQYVDILVVEPDGHLRSRYFMNAPLEPAR